jgi:hypothetical protein
VALPQGSLQIGVQCAVLRPAVGSGGAPRFRLHGPFGCLANAPCAKWSLRRSFSSISSLVDGGAGGNLTRGRRPLSRRLGTIHACGMQRAHDTVYAAEYYHRQPEAAPLAPRGRWAQSPGAGFVRGPGRASDAACHFEDTQAPPGPLEPPSPARRRACTSGLCRARWLRWTLGGGLTARLVQGMGAPLTGCSRRLRRADSRDLLTVR